MAAVLELLLADARTPTGAYAHSGGLEAALDGGAINAGEIPTFIAARLATVGFCEAAIAARACLAACVGQLLELELEWAARTPSPALRRAGRQLGRGFLRTAVSCWPDDSLLAGYHQRSELTPRPVVQGAVAHAAGLRATQAARLQLYDDAATVAAAAVKLVALDAARASSWLVGLADEIDRLAVAAASAQADGASLPSTATPLLDARALTHGATDGRLFAS
jgi:urease accessory protein